MAENTTPRTGGRGRNIENVKRLHYTTLGNPVDIVQPSSLAKVQQHREEDQVPSGFAETGDQGGISRSRKTSTKSLSTASSAVRKLELVAKKKTLELNRSVRKKKSDLAYQKTCVQVLYNRLTQMKEYQDRNPSELNVKYWADRHELESDIAEKEMQVGLLSSELEALEADVIEETSIIQEELELEKEDILSDDGHSSEDEADKRNRISNWMESTTQVVNHQSQQNDHPYNSIPVIENNVAYQQPTTTEAKHKVFEPRPKQVHMSNQRVQNNFQPAPAVATLPPTQSQGLSVADLVTALGQAFPQRQQDVVIKNKVDIDLQEFTGNPEDWIAFEDQFQRTTRMYRLTDTDNLYRLRKALKGSALNSVKYLFNCPSNVNEIMESLQLEFGRSELIIESMIEKAKSARNPDIKNPSTMVEFARIVQSLVATIKGHKQEKNYLENAHLLKVLVNKLPTYKQEQWFEWYNSSVDRDKNLHHFCEWISLQKRIACEMTTPKGHDDRSERKNNRRHVGASATSEEKTVCNFCDKSNHKLGKCYLFKKKTTDEKWEFVKQRRLCFCCLEANHNSKNCPNKTECSKDNCSSYHHVTLHRDPAKQDCQKLKKDKESAVADGGIEQIQEGTSAVAYAYSLPVIAVKAKHNGEIVKTHAFLDCGSTFSYIESDLASLLKLEGEKETTNVVLFGGKKATMETALVDISISGSSNSAEFCQMKDVRTIDKLGLPARSHDFEELRRNYPHLKTMHARSFTNATPKILIGFDNYDLFAARRILEDNSKEDAPRAYKSKLGWYVSHKGNDSQGHCNVSALDEETHEIVRRYFMAESFGVKPIKSMRSKEDEQALQLLEKTTKFHNGKWETGLLWREENATLPQSYQSAMKRLQGMERKMDRDPDLAALVMKKFEEYITKGYLKKVETKSNDKTYFLPWFFAYHPTKKPRLVLDAAAKSEGKSFNDFMLKGPDFLRSLPAVLLRFRLHRVALTGDIKEMFHQVKLSESDQPSQTVLYRGMERKMNAVQYQMTVLFFGSASSPCSAIYCKDKNAERYQEQYPTAVKAIKLDHYMDDFLGGAISEEAAIKLRQQISEVHGSGGFQMCKWNSNSATVLESVPPELRALEDIQLLEKSDAPSDKTLGLWWNPSKDIFQFRVSLHKVKEDVKSGERIPTKREVASLISSLYDPLGFICPLKIIGMRILQEVWRSGVGWDDSIPMSMFAKWKEWLCYLPNIENLHVQRPLSFHLSECQDVQLHIFNDGSDEAYSCSLYLRVNTGGRVEVAFISGKVRIAPMKGQTIPRMELDAALLGSRMARSVSEAYGDDLRIHKRIFWTDSKTVLCWLRSTRTRFNQYVGSRVGEIQELTRTNEWRWIPTKENVADDATRSTIAEELTSDCRWLTGPKFLLNEETTWPAEPIKLEVNNDELEMKKVLFVAVSEFPVHLPNITRFSSWMRLIRATAAVLVAVDVMRKKRKFSITVKDMRKAELLWILQTQNESFPDEQIALKNGKGVPKSSKLNTLSPTLNEQGIIIMKGRITAANASNRLKFPPILDPAHQFTELLIDWYHRLGQHFGQERILNELRGKYWILNARSAVRKSWRRCRVCKERSLKPQPPLMGDLPQARMDCGKPVFYNTGIDYFGPYEIKQGRAVVKRWGVMFSCLTTRAVHFEIAENLESSEMLNALVRFVNLRGYPAHIWSDNGTNLVGANNEIKKSLQSLDKERIQQFSTAKGMEWHFIPPASPHMGGSWERMIGSAKRILKTLLKEQHPRETTMRTLFAEVTGILNSRPLTHVSPDPDDSRCITPNDLLNVKCVVGPSIPGEFVDGDQYRKSWRYGQLLAEQFWKRWSAEYLPWLARRQKWHERVPLLKVGDLVVVLEDDAPRNMWKKGIILETFEGKDKQVRSVLVKLAHVDKENPKKVKISILKRPAVKVAKLESCGETFVSREGEM